METAARSSSDPGRPRVRGWSLRVARLAGIDVFVHATFLLLLVGLGGAELRRSGSVRAAGLAVVFVLGVFACVVLHELGHALVARRRGIGTRDITLYPIGGVASLARIPEKPGDEAVIAVAGPLVNVAIAALLGGLLWAVPGLGTLGAATAAEGPLVPRLLITNLALAGFNLLPAFPMDGGRVLRALLSKVTDRTRATRAAARIGQAMALVFGLLGLFGSPMLLLLALFVGLAAEQEARSVEVEDVLRGISVQGAMERRFDVLRADAALEEAARTILSGPQVDFPVLAADGHLVGIVGREEVARGLSEGSSARIGDFTRPHLPPAAPEEPLRVALERLAPARWRTVPVLDRAGRLVGLLTSENVAELVMFQEAARRGAARHPRG